MKRSILVLGVLSASLLAGAFALGQDAPTPATKPAVVPQANEAAATRPAAASNPSSAEASAEGIVVRVTGLEIQKARKQREYSRKDSLQLTLTCSSDGKAVLGLDDSSTIAEFSDDTGKSLLGSKKNIFPPGTETNSDGSADIKIQVEELPAAEAKHLHIKGAIVLTVASQPKVSVQKDVELTAGTKIRCGSFEGKIEPQAHSNAGFTNVHIESNGDFNSVLSIKFIAADGTTIDSNMNGTSQSHRMSEDGRKPIVRFGRTYRMRAQDEPITIEMETYEKQETVEVPIDLTFSVGL